MERAQENVGKNEVIVYNEYVVPGGAVITAQELSYMDVTDAISINSTDSTETL